MRTDLNLLKALCILVEERNVSRAADRFFVTRSGMSKTLHRLREALDDPLLIRTPEGLAPTPRAEELAALMKTMFAHLESVSGKFDPSQASGRVRIAAPETFAIGAVPNLLKKLHDQAPHLRLESIHLEDGYQERLADGTLDFVIYFCQEYPSGFVTHALFPTAPVVWCRKGHPVTKKKEISLDDICDYPKVASHHPSIKLAELLDIYKTLEQTEFSREVLFETSHLLVVLVTLCQTDALMISSDYLFQYEAFADLVTALPVAHIPVLNRLRFDICLVQHKRTLNSPLHQWITEETINMFKGKQAATHQPASSKSTAQRLRAV